MFHAQRKDSMGRAAFRIVDLIFHNAVRSVRRGHRDATLAIVTNMLQTMLMVVVFYFLFDILGLRGLAIRGDFLLYVMSGIFVFMTHVKSAGAIYGSDGPTSPMMQHAPMNTMVSIWSAAISALYTQSVSMMVILFGYHLIWTPISISQPFGAACMLLLAWFSGVAVGTVFLAMKPWLPGTTGIVQQLYMRVNMFASGKMFVANQLTAAMVAMFSWNPLFHIIDQGRGYVFINYNPHNSNLAYPIIMSFVILMLGLLAESFTRRHVSLSWTAGR